MKIQIELDGSILAKIQKLANDDQRSRKQMIEIIVQRAVK